jgi:hypothetical protein
MTKTEADLHPDAGGNKEQFDDGRDAKGRLPEPLDAAHFGNPDGPGLDLPGMPASQPAGTGPVVSSPVVPFKPADADDDADDARASYDNNTVTELGDELAARGLPKTGNKADMVARLEEDDAAKAAEAATAEPVGLATMPRAQG